MFVCGTVNARFQVARCLLCLTAPVVDRRVVTLEVDAGESVKAPC